VLIGYPRLQELGQQTLAYALINLTIRGLGVGAARLCLFAVGRKGETIDLLKAQETLATRTPRGTRLLRFEFSNLFRPTWSTTFRR